MFHFLRFVLFSIILMSLIAINYKKTFHTSKEIPQELRDESVYRLLSGSFRIENKFSRGGAYGSGTLCYYDRKTNTGYIITCGHLFQRG